MFTCPSPTTTERRFSPHLPCEARDSLGRRHLRLRLDQGAGRPSASTCQICRALCSPLRAPDSLRFGNSFRATGRSLSRCTPMPLMCSTHGGRASPSLSLPRRHWNSKLVRAAPEQGKGAIGLLGSQRGNPHLRRPFIFLVLFPSNAQGQRRSNSVDTHLIVKSMLCHDVRASRPDRNTMASAVNEIKR